MCIKCINEYGKYKYKTKVVSYYKSLHEKAQNPGDQCGKQFTHIQSVHERVLVVFVSLKLHQNIVIKDTLGKS